jgi:hypothetical protein
MLPAATAGRPRAARRRQPDRAERLRDRPDKKVKLIIVYPMTTGRNFDEVLRVIDSLQLTATHKVSTPVNWKQGEDVIIAGSVSDEDAKKTYPDGWKAPRPYIRIVPRRSRQAGRRYDRYDRYDRYGRYGAPSYPRTCCRLSSVRLARIPAGRRRQ